MKRLEFENIYEFVQKVITVFEDDLSDHHVAVYGKYDFIKDVLEHLIGEGYPIGIEIELENYEIGNYDREFVLYLTEDGINVEKMWHDENEYYEARYYDSESNVAFVHDECNSKLLKYIQSNIMFEVSIENYKKDKDYQVQTYDNGIAVTRVKRNDDGTPCGFTKSWSTNEDDVVYSSVYSYFTTDPYSLCDIAEKFDVKL